MTITLLQYTLCQNMASDILRFVWAMPFLLVSASRGSCSGWFVCDDSARSDTGKAGNDVVTRIESSGPIKSVRLGKQGVCAALCLLIAPLATATAVEPPQLTITNTAHGLVQISWYGESNVSYTLQQSTNVTGWESLIHNIYGSAGAARIERSGNMTIRPKAFYRVLAAPFAAGERCVLQTLDDFEWPSDPDPAGQESRGYRYYGRLAADRGDMGDGTQFRSLSVSNGRLRAIATTGPSGTSWVGQWHSTSHTALETNEVLNFAAPLPSPIKTDYQMPIVGIQAIVRGRGLFKVELKGPQQQLLQNWTCSVDSALFVTNVFMISHPGQFPTVKLINLVVESPSLWGTNDLEFEEINLAVSVPAWLYDDPLRYAFVTTYGAMLRAYDPQSGHTRDHTHWPAGDFDSIPGDGFQALGAAMAADLGVIPEQAASQIIASCIQAIASVPRHQGLPPHWMEGGQPKDFSTVDGALCYIPALQAAWILGMTNEEEMIIGLIDGINWTPLSNVQNEVSYGYTTNLVVSPYVWTNWGPETYLVQTLRLMQNPGVSLFRFDTNPPVYGGRGFIVELGALFAPQFGHESRFDRFGINFRDERLEMLQGQLAYFSSNYPGSVAAQRGLFGLSPIETIDASANTSYAELGIGSPGVPAYDAEGWLSSHYAAMAASLNLSVATNFVLNLGELGVLQPLIGLPEGVKAGNSGARIDRWHSAQISLNASFSVVGLYHAIRVMDGADDEVYRAAEAHPRMRAALDVLFP